MYRCGSALLVALLASASIGAPLHAQQPPRIIAIGDIHDSFDGITAILKRAGVIDATLKWSGGRATLVQTGDYTDRGTDVRKVLDLLMRLEGEAKAAGGQAIILLGNHEVMNLIGDWRDVTPAICATFATAQSEARRDETWKQQQRLTQGRPAATTAQELYARSREAWMEAHPPGCLEYREAMSPRGVYGKWLREKSIAAQVGDSLFMHAGINPARPAPKSIAEVNDRARADPPHRCAPSAAGCQAVGATLVHAATTARRQRRRTASGDRQSRRQQSTRPRTAHARPAAAPRSAGDAEHRHLEPARSRRATLVPRLRAVG